jgi:hypothetical protein
MSCEDDAIISVPMADGLHCSVGLARRRLCGIMGRQLYNGRVAAALVHSLLLYPLGSVSLRKTPGAVSSGF